MIHEDGLNAGLISYSISLFMKVMDTTTSLHGAAIHMTKI
jgi:hypothetical protein